MSKNVQIIPLFKSLHPNELRPSHSCVISESSLLHILWLCKGCRRYPDETGITVFTCVQAS